MVETQEPAYNRWKEILWPIGGTVLALIAMPVAIAQYPKFFNENRWLLPASVLVVVLFWIAPFLIHENASRLFKWASSGGTIRKALSVICGLILVLLGASGARLLFRFHTKHLTASTAIHRTNLTDDKPRADFPADSKPIPQGHASELKNTSKVERRTRQEQVPLIFKDSPLFTSTRKANISKTVDGCYSYLNALGFPVKNELPPIGVSQTNVFHGAGIYPGTVYDRHVFIPRNRVDDAGEISRIYADYVFADLFHANEPGRQDFDERAVWVYSLYFASSYVGHPIGEIGHPTSPILKWLKRLWAVRERKGKDFTDRSLFFAYKTWMEPAADDKDFDKFFSGRFLYGVHVVANDFNDMGEINKIFASVN